MHGWDDRRTRVVGADAGPRARAACMTVTGAMQTGISSGDGLDDRASWLSSPSPLRIWATARVSTFGVRTCPATRVEEFFPHDDPIAVLD